MKLFISYFYQIRYFKPYQIPMSTATYDPKWFHDNTTDQYHIFIDKNGVYNGFRIGDFAPDDSCKGLCSGINNCKLRTPWNCDFLTRYRNQLSKIDFNKLMTNLEQFADKIKEINKFDHEIELILIVYEAPDNHCSERESIQTWFKSYGYDLKEWRKDEDN